MAGVGMQIRSSEAVEKYHAPTGHLRQADEQGQVTSPARARNETGRTPEGIEGATEGSGSRDESEWPHEHRQQGQPESGTIPKQALRFQWQWPERAAPLRGLQAGRTDVPLAEGQV